MINEDFEKAVELANEWMDVTAKMALVDWHCQGPIRVDHRDLRKGAQALLWARDEMERLKARDKEWEQYGQDYSVLCRNAETAAGKIKEQAEAIEEAEEIFKMYAEFENQDDAFAQTYNRTAANFNYPGSPRAVEWLRKWGKKK